MIRMLLLIVCCAAIQLSTAGASAAEAPTIVVTRDALCGGQITTMQCGQFVEYLCDLVPSMWAERLQDGSFEGLTPYPFEFIRETDFKAKPWYPSGAVNRGRFIGDRSTRISGEQSKKISVSPGPPAVVGLSQDGIFVERDKPCTFSCWMKQEGIAGPVRVQLGHEAADYATAQFTPDAQWRKYTARLTPTATDASATLTIDFRGAGTLWLDNASLMPDDNLSGWRPNVVEAIRGLHPGFIRFGGSAVEDENRGNFEWKDTIGDADHRKPWRAWGGLQQTGAGLEELVQLCQRVGAEPLICVRVTHRTPKDAADEVEYFNGAASTPMGAWRGRNGHPQPYGIKYWQVGNELGGPLYEWELGEFCKAMHAADPQIKLLSSYPSPGVIASAAKWIDYMCPHHYDCRDLQGCENDLLAVTKLCSTAPHPLKIGVTEWNTTAGDWGVGRAQLWDLSNALACSRYHNLLQRHCDVAELACRSNLINSFCSGCIQLDNHRLYKTPTYYAEQLYATESEPIPLRLRTAGASPLDISATASADRTRIAVFIVNDTDHALPAAFDLSAVLPSLQSARMELLTDTRSAGEPNVTNTFADPTRVQPTTASLPFDQGKCQHTFPAWSLTVLTCGQPEVRPDH